LNANVNPCILNNFALAYYSIYIICNAVFFVAGMRGNQMRIILKNNRYLVNLPEFLLVKPLFSSIRGVCPSIRQVNRHLSLLIYTFPLFPAVFIIIFMLK
tara:strand:+ start:680 stop:979 length:300 start_codon:yes stop_codon:yes gene_type:complete